jgi:disulfide oxidoreductase YuzD
VREEMRDRFGDAARIDYLDTSKPDVRVEHAEMVALIQEQGFVYPVTVIGDDVVYHGAVSYPAIIRAVQSRLESASDA